MVIEYHPGAIFDPFTSVLGRKIEIFHKFEISSLLKLNLHLCNKYHRVIASDTIFLHIGSFWAIFKVFTHIAGEKKSSRKYKFRLLCQNDY